MIRRPLHTYSARMLLILTLLLFGLLSNFVHAQNSSPRALIETSRINSSRGGFSNPKTQQTPDDDSPTYWRVHSTVCKIT